MTQHIAPNASKWSKKIGTNRHGVPMYNADPDQFYPYLMKEFGFEEVDQYTLECCYQAMKMDCQFTYGFDIEIRTRGKEGFKDRWAQKNHPPGLGANAAIQHKRSIVVKGDPSKVPEINDARANYRRVRGFIPT